MVQSRLSWRSSILVGTAWLLASCASEPPVASSSTPPNVRFGSVLDLLSIKTASDHVHTMLDVQGNAHVFIVATRTHEVYHLVVSPDNTVQREMVESNTSSSSISAAFDADYNLHLLLDDKHLVLVGSTWKISHDTPWENAGIKVSNPKFVQGKKGLVWTFLVDGKDVGAQGRWDWYGFGGGPAGIIFPWHATSRKLVIVPDAALAERMWYVLDPQDNYDISNAMLSADNKGDLHIFYDASRGGLAASNLPRYAEINLMPPLSRADNDAPGIKAGNRPLFPIRGNTVPSGFGRSDLNQAAIALDPETGTVLLVRAHDASLVLTDGNWSLPQRLPLSHFWEPKLAPAGGDGFHAMMIGQAVPEEWWSSATTVLYLRYARGVWSAPVTLGQAKVSSFWGSMWDALGIASNGLNRAFIVWPIETGIVGCWVDGTIERKIENQ